MSMSSFDKFKKAIIEMYKDGEFEKILKYCPRSERSKVKNDMKVAESYTEYYEYHDQDIKSFSAIPLFMALKSVEVYKNALAYMLNYDDKEA